MNILTNPEAGLASSAEETQFPYHVINTSSYILQYISAKNNNLAIKIFNFFVFHISSNNGICRLHKSQKRSSIQYIIS
jgi:hypothetical protein